MAEIPGLDQTLFDQGLQAVIDLAQADTEPLRQGPLADPGIFFQYFQYVVSQLIGRHGIVHSLNK
jgi:hypothetical protein